jgi:hypothetical protein
MYTELEAQLAALPGNEPDGEITEGRIVNNAVFLALWRYRKQAGVIREYLDGFTHMRAEVEDLKARAENIGDPYDSLRALPGRTAALDMTPMVSNRASR